MGGCKSKSDSEADGKPGPKKVHLPSRPTLGSPLKQKYKPTKHGTGRPTLQDLRSRHRMNSTEDREEADPDATARGSQFLRSGGSLKRLMNEHSVLVVCRLRPLNKRENVLNSASCVTVTTSSQLRIDAGDGQPRNFSYDACFRGDATQADVYERSGRMVLGKVLEGYNGCVFAYGQTGSGKTWTMQGGEKSEDRGVIPRLTAELFERVAGLSGAKSIRCSISMCEIYNERLRDLLAPLPTPSTLCKAAAESADLSIKNDPTPGGRGIFVDGLSEFPVDSEASALRLISAGQVRRATGKTNMNEYSSRSHSIVTLRVTSVDAGDDAGLTAITAKLHLIDLAGSERQKSTGATGAALKEGAQINLSLSALGNVINALTEKQGGRPHVPYRDSKLTRLLQDSLGGNSVTVMLCALSPATINAQETLSALRFAERAKKIENAAIINCDPKAAKAAALFKENKDLLAKIRALEAYVADLESNY